MKFKAIIWKYHKLKDGTYPIKIRIRSGDKATYFPLDFYVKPHEFDSKAGRVRDGHQNAQAINLRILKTLQEIEKKHIEDPHMEAADLMSKGAGSDSFYFYFNRRLEFIQKKFSDGHYRKNRAIRDKMMEFAPNLTVKQFNWRFLQDFEQYLLEKGNHVNTIVDNMGRIETVVTEIIKEGKLLYHENPFLSYTISKEDIFRERLSIDEIKAIEELYLEKHKFDELSLIESSKGKKRKIRYPNTWDYHVRNFFFFSFYCGGIRRGDFCRLKKKNVKDGYLHYFMKKRTRTNKKERRIVLLDQALKIIQEYKNSPGEYLFPLLKPKYKDVIEMEKHISSIGTMINNSLKRIAKKAEIKKDISFHTSRHSIADYLVQMGVDMRTIQEILGHSKIGTTEVYTKPFFPEQTEKAMRKLFENKV